jgi:hypothetical protein
MANQLDRLLEGVSDNNSVHGSVSRLMRNIAAEAEHAGAAINPAASTALGESLKTHAEHIASHVLANTPVIAATPPVHAKPAHAHDSHDSHVGHDPHAADALEVGTEQPAEDHRTKRQIAADERAAARGE